MDTEKGKLLDKLNPRNYKLGTKIHLIIFSLVLFTLLFAVVSSLIMFRKTLINNSLTHLQDLAYIKSSEIEQKIIDTEKKLLELSQDDRLISASAEFKSAFSSLLDEKYDLLVPDVFAEINTEVTKYYKEDIAPLNALSGNTISAYIPQRSATLIIQYLFMISQNENVPGKKDNKSSFIDNSSYSQAHAGFHNYLKQLRNDLNASDLYIVDPVTGDIVYSVDKNLEFGSNLYEGRFKKSTLSTAFRKAVSSQGGVVSFVDFSIFEAAFDQPVAFISVPVYSYSELVSVLILQINTDFLDNVLYDKGNFDISGSLEYSVIGEDLFLRNNPKAFLLNRIDFVNTLLKSARRSEIEDIMKYRTNGNMALLAKFPEDLRNDLQKKEYLQVRDYKGELVLAGYKKFNILGTDHYLISKQDRSEVLKGYSSKLTNLFLISIVLLILTYITGKLFSGNLKYRISLLRDSMIHLYKGEKQKSIDTGAPDELGETIGAYNNLRDRMVEASEFAIEMSQGNFNHEFKIYTDTDSLGKSMNKLKEKMIQSKKDQEERHKEDDIRNWLNGGIAKFNDLLRQSNNDLQALSYLLIENLIDYLKANLGGVFIVDEDEISDKHIRLVASYAYDRKKYTKKTIEIGEGILGNIYLEKKSVYLKEIPEDYIDLQSGLGHAIPRYLYIVPLKVDQEVLGMIELASIHEFEIHHIEFIEKVAESIAATFVSVRLNMQTSRLLKESNSKAEAIAQQEEEMRQNLEEMQATQEELARLRLDDEKSTHDLQLTIDNTRRLLKNLLDAIPGGYVLKDPNGIIQLVNTEGAEYYGQAVDSVKGKTDYELLNADQFEIEHKADLEAIEKGEKLYTEELVIKGNKKRYRVIKKPFRLEEIHQNGILTIRNEIEK